MLAAKYCAYSLNAPWLITYEDAGSIKAGKDLAGRADECAFIAASQA